MTEYRVYCLNSKHYRDTFLPHAFSKELSESLVVQTTSTTCILETSSTYNVIMVIQTQRGKRPKNK